MTSEPRTNKGNTMNKMAKGALATGVGVALLLGGGGTLAVWNQTVSANAGTIAAGDLKLKAETGVWTSNLSGEIENINLYKIVPGEALTYTQELGVTLKGDRMAATLGTSGDPIATFGPNDVSYTGPVFTNEDGEALPTVTTEGRTTAQLTPADTGTVTATATFTFKDVDGRKSAEATAQLSNIEYVLTQKVPTPAAP